jgi:hypothetical protein
MEYIMLLALGGKLGEPATPDDETVAVAVAGEPAAEPDGRPPPHRTARRPGPAVATASRPRPLNLWPTLPY